MKFYIDFDHTLFNTNIMVNDMIEGITEYIYDNGDFENYSNNFSRVFPNMDLVNVNKELGQIQDFIRTNFKRPEQTVLKIKYNIFALIDVLGKLFNCNYYEMEKIINDILNNGEKNLYGDSKHFLKLLKSQGHEVYILTHEKNDLEFQRRKVCGSGVCSNEFIHAIIITKEVKAELTRDSLHDINQTNIVYPDGSDFLVEDIDYQNGIFVDDRPKDLEAYFKRVYQNENNATTNNNAINNIRVFRIAREAQTYTSQDYSSKEFETGIITVNDLDSILEQLNLNK